MLSTYDLSSIFHRFLYNCVLKILYLPLSFPLFSYLFLPLSLRSILLILNFETQRKIPSNIFFLNNLAALSYFASFFLQVLFIFPSFTCRLPSEHNSQSSASPGNQVSFIIQTFKFNVDSQSQFEAQHPCQPTWFHINLNTQTCHDAYSHFQMVRQNMDRRKRTRWNFNSW